MLNQQISWQVKHHLFKLLTKGSTIFPIAQCHWLTLSESKDYLQAALPWWYSLSLWSTKVSMASLWSQIIPYIIAGTLHNSNHCEYHHQKSFQKHIARNIQHVSSRIPFSTQATLSHQNWGLRRSWVLLDHYIQPPSPSPETGCRMYYGARERRDFSCHHKKDSSRCHRRKTSWARREEGHGMKPSLSQPFYLPHSRRHSGCKIVWRHKRAIEPNVPCCFNINSDSDHVDVPISWIRARRTSGPSSDAVFNPDVLWDLLRAAIPAHHV